MDTDVPIVVITPEARDTLEAEAERSGISGDVVGGLLFGYPLDGQHRLVVDLVRPRPEVGFGQKGFSLNQSRTSQKLKEARSISSDVSYCGVWYVHRTPNRELTDDEWVQAQGVLEDPDYHFKDLVCLVTCLYFGELNTYAFSFDLKQSARGQMPRATLLKRGTAEQSPASPARVKAAPVPAPPSRDWYKSPDVAGRLEIERKWLTRRYRVESAAASDGRVIFRLMPQGEHEDMVFYVACSAGFPEKAPVAFLIVRGDRYPLLCPALNEWSPDKWLFQVADDLVKWQVGLLDRQVEVAEEALRQGDCQRASDLLAMVLLIEPRRPKAARLLAQAESRTGT